ncbi:unnamed protein product [Acanthoscelides obtectus]|uniref:Uncharacterized protein n=1 Tax=Acanthoscelides obtectus TaxID=200917 RepID=A0A9P0L387_ACAOB|nr:unnamed protein product [Acanthoscelides obtectus]CAK1666171.1 hypothetical protein AOBTE_LOCUS25192 [Acanthoscelides obtectus]
MKFLTLEYPSSHFTFTSVIVRDYLGSRGDRSSRLFGLLMSRRALCGFESRPKRNFSLGYGCCDCTTRRIS